MVAALTRAQVAPHNTPIVLVPLNAQICWPCLSLILGGGRPWRQSQRPVATEAGFWHVRVAVYGNVVSCLMGAPCVRGSEPEEFMLVTRSRCAGWPAALSDDGCSPFAAL